ncbi:hypothetical protein DL765_003735 [Monosporascus sp. GIB2]|nr:hypothetical protein DL765_003735 [Monosporascus sp. GIB2]
MSAAEPFDAFRSERLVYRDVEDSPEDKAFVYSIQRDVRVQSITSYGLLRPENKRSSNKFKEHIAEKCILGAIICLPPASEDEVAGKPIGIVCLTANPPHFAHHRNSEISINIARAHRGNGYGAEAIMWSLWYGFQMAGLHRMEIHATSFNFNSISWHKRLGFKEEGRLREHVWFNGGWHDDIVFGVLEHEWREMSKEARGYLEYRPDDNS